MSEQKDILQIKDLCVDFTSRTGQVRVLDHLNITLRQGESLGIVGESGCGKSMTALAVMRLIPSPPGHISEGRILLKGRDLLELDENQMQGIRGNEISMIFQEPMTSLNPVFTVGSQIAENIRRHQKASRTEALKIAAQMMNAVKIPAPKQRIKQYPHELSGGMRQRIMIAMALCCQPGILIADEPTTALDVTVQAQIFNLLLEIQKETGTSIILITHDMGVIAEVVQRVVVMYAGHKFEEGPVEVIMGDPHHPYTKGLIRCVPRLEMDPAFKWEELQEIPGSVPDLSRLGPGCPFNPRCESAMPKCSEEKPGEVEIGPDHKVSCWLWTEGK